MEKKERLPSSGLLVVPLMVALDTTIKDTHGLIGTANLDLQKVGLLVVAGGTDGHGPIHILPGSGSSQDIVDHFSFGKGLHRLWGGDGTRVGTSRTVKVTVGSARAQL